VCARPGPRLQEGGYQIVECDARRGSVTTARREREHACGKSTCLERESLAVLLGHRAAKVTVTRELFDAAVRGWVPAPRAAAETDADRIARELVAEPGARAAPGADPCPLLAPPPPPAAPEPEPDPFADAPAPVYGERAASR
jgi:hypothetical protein